MMMSLIRNRLFQLAGLVLLAHAFSPSLPLGAHAADSDGDGVEDHLDKCPYTFDDDQADSNGDGIGDACQCGDVDDDGFVSEADGLLVKQAALSLDPYMAAVGLPGFDKCDVGGTEGCSGLDGSIVMRAVNGHAPALQQVCAAASAAVTNNLALSSDGPFGEPVGLVDPEEDVQLGHAVTIRIGLEATEAVQDVAVEFFLVDKAQYIAAGEGSEIEELPTQYILGAASIESVAAGSAEYTLLVHVPGVDLEGNPIPAGEYYLFPVIDPGKDIAETNETDNVVTEEEEFAVVTVSGQHQLEPIVALQEVVLDFSGVALPAELLRLPDQDPEPPNPCDDAMAPPASFELPEELIENLANSTVAITAVLIASGPPIPSVVLEATFDHPRLTSPIVLEFWQTYPDPSDLACSETELDPLPSDAAGEFTKQLRIPCFEPGLSTSVQMDLLLPIHEPAVVAALEAALEDLASVECIPGCPGYPSAEAQACVARCIALELLSEAEAAELEIKVTAYDDPTGGNPILRNWTPPSIELPENIFEDVTIISPLFTPPPEESMPVRFEADFETGFHSALVSAGLKANSWAALDEAGAAARTEAGVPVSLFGLKFNFLHFDAGGRAYPHYPHPDPDLDLGFWADLKFATAPDGSGGIVVLSQPLLDRDACNRIAIRPDLDVLGEILKWKLDWSVEKSKDATADFVVGVVPLTASIGASGQLGFLVEAGIPVCSDDFGDETSFQAHTGPYFDVGMLASAGVGSSKAFAVGIEGEATLIEDTFYAKAEVLHLSLSLAENELSGTVREDITNTLDGPKGGLYLYVGYPCIEWCRWWGIPYPCGFKQCKSRQSIFKFRTYTKKDVIMCESQSTTLDVGP